jgi:D-serine deaminase-like pyridoxal phosphate-dependent protein
MTWFTINNIDTLDSPALVLYKERIIDNIQRLIEMVDDINALRPHVKTNKIAEVCALMMDKGITKFKCATIAEAEMLAMIKAPDVLLAYQPTGPKISRLIKLVQAYPQTRISCLIDDEKNATHIADLFKEQNITIDVFIDLNTGMNRSGIPVGEKAFNLFKKVVGLPGINPVGLHAYDGHIQDTDLSLRQQHSDTAFDTVIALSEAIKVMFSVQCKIVVGGSPSFPTHAHRDAVECSPGTFVFWDWGYKHKFPDEPFEYAALVITRVVSVIDSDTICLDLGHKSVAAENPLPRVHFLNAPSAIPVSQSEEHLVIKVVDGSRFTIGDVLYGVPVHICPTVALYEKAFVITNHDITDGWKVVARNRSITI